MSNMAVKFTKLNNGIKTVDFISCNKLNVTVENDITTVTIATDKEVIHLTASLCDMVIVYNGGLEIERIQLT